MDWNQIEIDFDRLSEETLWVVDQLREGRKAGRNQEEIEHEVGQKLHSIPIELEKNPEAPLHGPGVLYYIDRQGRTFTVKGISSGNLPDSYKDLLAKNDNLLSALRLLGDEQVEAKIAQVKVFPTPSNAAAEIIADQVFNRRFPLEEENFLNVSDPGANLWLLEASEGSNPDQFCLAFKKTFRIPNCEGQARVTALGPLIDPQVAFRRFRDLAEAWDMASPLDLIVDERAVVLHAHNFEERQLIEGLRQLFLEGTSLEIKDWVTGGLKGHTLQLFLQEVALTRRLWLSVLDNL